MSASRLSTPFELLPPKILHDFSHLPRLVRRHDSRYQQCSGFTLLEVMIAIAILAVSMTFILTSQSSAIFKTIRAKDYNLAGILARNLMVETEYLYEGKAFNDLKESESGDYPEPYKNFKWSRELHELKFPDFQMKEEESKEKDAQITKMITDTITKYLNKSVRELIVTVTWKHNDKEKEASKIQLTTYLIDLSATIEPPL